MAIPAQRRSLKKKFDETSKDVRDYLTHLPQLLRDFPLDVCLSYLFSQVELAHNMTLYCGVVKLHKANRDVARQAVNVHHMTRNGFAETFRIIFDIQIREEVTAPLRIADDIRDKIMHGKSTTESEKREAISNVIDSAVAFNEFVHSQAKFRPFGPLRGFKGRAQSLDKSTTRWMLKGMGFTLS